MTHCIRPFAAGDRMMYFRQKTFYNMSWKLLSTRKERVQRPWLNNQEMFFKTWNLKKEWKEGHLTLCCTRPLVWSFLDWATTSRGTPLALKALYVKPLNAVENIEGSVCSEVPGRGSSTGDITVVICLHLTQSASLLSWQAIRNPPKAMYGLRSHTCRRHPQKLSLLWLTRQTGTLIFSSWKKPPITGGFHCRLTG